MKFEDLSKKNKEDVITFLGNAQLAKLMFWDIFKKKKSSYFYELVNNGYSVNIAFYKSNKL